MKDANNRVKCVMELARNHNVLLILASFEKEYLSR
jgi:hypothetical protein